MIDKAKVFLACVLAAITYGIIHDQITAHLCVEYFTVAHPPLFHTDSPTILAFCWGICATVGVGAALGVLLAQVSQSKGPPPFPIPRLCRSILTLLAVMALTAFLSGVLGFELSRHSIIRLPDDFAALITPERRDRFMAVWFAHCASYFSGIVGGAILAIHVWIKRGKPRAIALIPRSGPEIIRAMFIGALIAVVLYLRFFRS